MNGKMQKLLAVVVVGAIIWFIPAPAGVQIKAWHLFAVFAATILGLVLQPFPMGTMALAGITFPALIGLLSPAQALSGFGNPVIWLLVVAFLLARGFVKSGFGRRVAFLIMRAIGDKTLKLGYVLVLTDLIIAPSTPAANARGGAIVYPIAKSLSSTFDSEPGPTAKKIGAYLIQTEMQGNVVTSCMFMTSAAVNPLMTGLAQKVLHVQLSWGTWALAGLVPGLICLALVPWIMYKIYPPEIKETPEAKKIAAAELEKMGPMTRPEKIMLAVLAGSLLLWSTALITKIDSTAVALLCVCVMLFTDVINFKDVTEERASWDALIWMGSLLTLTTYLADFGLIPWFGKVVGASLQGVSWPVALGVLAFVYMYCHYGFASMTAHVSTLFPVFIAVAAATGAPVLLSIMVMAVFSTLCGAITHYASGASPVFFGSGYITQAEWWRLGFIMGTFYFIVFGTVGVMWWKVLGIW